jgi:acid phosphatase type 7
MRWSLVGLPAEPRRFRRKRHAQLKDYLSRHVPLYSLCTARHTLSAVVNGPIHMIQSRPAKLLILFLLAFVAAPLPPLFGQQASVRGTVASIIERMNRELSTNELSRLTPQKVEQFLTANERDILATRHVTFRVNVPVRLSVLKDSKLKDEPFWLQQRGFLIQTNLIVKEGSDAFEVWQKDFDAGSIGLGIHSFTGSGNHYLVLLAPRIPRDKINVSDLYPAELSTAEFRAGVEPYVDQPVTLKAVPPELEGQVLICTDTEREEDARLINIFRWTQFVASSKPDQVMLTWSEDPRTSQTIQWRTSVQANRGYVDYQKKSDHLRFQPLKPSRETAQTTRLETRTLLNDRVVYRHTAVLRGLTPGSTYVYSVGDGSEEGWTELSEFTTAPAAAQSFSFIYMGDPQTGLDRWGTLLHNAFRARPDAAFYLLAGDIVNRGAERNEWDNLFRNAEGVFDRRPVMPALGNHDCQGGQPRLYLEQFALPRNGPSELVPERVYSFEYGNCLFVILDGNLNPRKQAPWLEETLSRTKATWKFAVYHHPAYSSGGNRDNAALRRTWTPLFDKYHLDLALQGHDHAYLRTYPMKAGKRVASPKDGTVYIISVSGTKLYAQPKHDYAEFGMTKVSTYQVIDIQTSGNRLVYRAYDIDGKLRDELVIEK